MDPTAQLNLLVPSLIRGGWGWAGGGQVSERHLVHLVDCSVNEEEEERGGGGGFVESRSRERIGR
jgi:hypothetical protein